MLLQLTSISERLGHRTGSQSLLAEAQHLIVGARMLQANAPKHGTPDARDGYDAEADGGLHGQMKSVASSSVPDQIPTLAFYRKDVSSEDPGRIFVVRRIHRLGFDSDAKLSQHYSHYGEVIKVLVAHRKHYSHTGEASLRPGDMALIVMKHSTSVDAILAVGTEQMVSGQQVRVLFFKPDDGRHRSDRL